ncbi:signal peptidase II [Lachnospiraceae bacterium NSJ-143]|nr:signal peptidase II [Lachnospiraceae bacterium NSJ-143]
MVYALIVLSIICTDLFTKRLISDNLNIEERKEIVKNCLYIWHRKNKGFSYEHMSDRPDTVKFFSGVMCAVSAVMFIYLSCQKGMKALKFCFSLCFAGALSNFIDRVRNGSVTDFIFVKFKNAPVFNIADIFIVLGCISFWISSFRKKI